MAVVAGWLALALLLADCASPDCAETATCAGVEADVRDAAEEASADASQDATMAPDASYGSDASDASYGSDASDATVADGAVAAEGAAAADEGAAAADGGDALDGVGDATAPEDGDADAQRADASPDAADASPDACVPTEICTDGIDNDCNKKIDCADPACSGFTCVPPIPNFWTGPAMLWTVPFSAMTPPACPAGFSASDFFSGPTGANGTCSCTCTPTGQSCSGNITLYSDQTCQAACATVAVTSGACSPVTGCNGSQGTMISNAPRPSGGTCVGTASMTPGPAPSFSSRARLCTFAGQADSPGGCAAGQQCLTAPSAPFGTSVCVYRSGVQSSCPAPYTGASPSIFYTGESDGRGCGPCTCSAAPLGGTCGGTIGISGTSTCMGPWATYSGSGCQKFTLSQLPTGAQPSFTLSAPGACSLLAPSQPTGAVTGTEPITVCCL